ncbi:hypothetical protein LBMAG21_05510 [Armatimonadota bacterium]|nr:hypothetical protein LBMAG21_05510 [Armatimonadota bacterium]
MRPAKLIFGFLLFVSLVVNVVLYVKFRSRRPILKVNGESITKKDVNDYLEQKNPNIKAVMVERVLVKSEAVKQGVWPAEQEIIDIYNEKKELDWQFARRVNTNPWMVAEEKSTIQYDLARQRLLTKDVQVDDAMLEEEYNIYKAAYDTPDKARLHLTLLFRKAPIADVRSMLEKVPQQAPADIARAFPGQVVFLGDKDVFTVTRALGGKAASPQLQDLFNLKPGEVREFPAEELRSLGAQTILARMVEVVPGKPADKNEPKTHEKLRMGASLRRAKPWQEKLTLLWGNSEFWSEDPNDKGNVEMMFFPDRATAATPKQ